jgi:two-component sensor histidine kinase
LRQINQLRGGTAPRLLKSAKTRLDRQVPLLDYQLPPDDRTGATMMRTSLRQRILGIAAIALVPAIAILAYNQLQLRLDRAAEIDAMALRQATLASIEVERIFEGFRRVLVVASVSNDLRGPNPTTCQTYLAEIVARVPGIASISVLDPEGRQVCGSTAGGAGSDASLSGVLAAALASGQLEPGGYTVNAATGRGELPLAMAFHGNGYAKPFIFAAAINLDWLGLRLRERGLAEGGQLTLADRTGVILTRDPLPERFVGKRIPDQYLPLVTAGKPGTIDVRSQDGTERILGYVPASVMPYGIYVSSGISKAEAFAPIDRASLVGLALILLGAMLALPVAWLAGQLWIQRPVEQILAVVDAWRSGHLEQRTGFRADADELESVGAALDRMADELKRRSDHAALLSRELTHRVKNILTVVRAMAGQTFRDSADRAARGAFSDRIAALAASFDVLAQHEWQGGDLREVLDRTLAPHQQPGVERIRFSGVPVALDASLALAVSMIAHELATNAIKYGSLSRDGGIVVVSWQFRDNHVRLLWEEKGGPIVRATGESGFGSRLIRHAIATQYEPAVQIEMMPEGLRCIVTFRPATFETDQPQSAQ